MLPVLLVIDEGRAVDAGIGRLKPRDEDQREQVQRPQPRHPRQPETPHRAAVGQIDMGKDKARDRPEILDRAVSIIEQPAQRVIERQHRRAVDLKAIVDRRHEEMLVMPEQHRKGRHQPREVKRVEMALGYPQAGQQGRTLTRVHGA
jgi:hypothetical protein